MTAAQSLHAALDNRALPDAQVCARAAIHPVITWIKAHTCRCAGCACRGRNRLEQLSAIDWRRRLEVAIGMRRGAS